jgi:hypothetical protein
VGGADHPRPPTNTLLNPASWDDRNEAHFIGRYKELARRGTVLAFCFLIAKCGQKTRTSIASKWAPPAHGDNQLDTTHMLG